MSTTSSHMLALIETVIEKRVQGVSWPAAGEAVKRSGETVRQWPTRYAEDWDRLYRKAHRRVIHESANEGRLILRSLAKTAKSEAIRRAAALDLAKLELQA